jgi:NADH-quinone oxidoreductase subunit K
MIGLWHYLAIAAVMFALGLLGFLTRRNFITMFLSAELMLQGVVINLLAFARYHGTLHGQVFALFIITIAACEAGIAMALFIALYRRTKSLDTGDWQSLRESGVPTTTDAEPLPPVDPEPEDPKLIMAGTRPSASREVARV